MMHAMLTITANDFRKEFDRHLAGEEPLLITTDEGKPLFVALSRNEYIVMHGYTDLLDITADITSSGRCMPGGAAAGKSRIHTAVHTSKRSNFVLIRRRSYGWMLAVLVLLLRGNAPLSQES